MFKRNVLRSLVLVLALGLIFGFCVPFCFAEESATITTYYPSPSGVYNESQTNKFAVGDTDIDGQLDSGDQPPVDGQLYTARSVIFKPQSSDPGSDRVPGEVIYNSSAGTFKYWNGSDWLRLGGGGCYVSYRAVELCEDDEDGQEQCEVCEGDDCCVPGFTNMGSAGGSAGWSGAADVEKPSQIYVMPQDDGTLAIGACGWERMGEAFVCCQ